MKKSGLIILAVFLLLFSVSCDTSFFSHDGQKVTVMVVGLDYARKGESTTDLSWGSYSIPHLNGTINDAKEIGAALDSLYRDRDIEHEMVFMISEGGKVDFDDSLYPTSSKVLRCLAIVGTFLKNSAASLTLMSSTSKMLFPLYLTSRVSRLYRLPLQTSQGTYTSGRKCISILIIPSPLQASHLPPLTLKLNLPFWKPLSLDSGRLANKSRI